MKSALVIFAVLSIVYHSVPVQGAGKCYLCIDDQCKTNPYVKNCGSKDSVCVSNTYKLSFSGQVLTSKYCATSGGIPNDCQEKYSGNTGSAYGCFYCHTDLCN